MHVARIRSLFLAFVFALTALLSACEKEEVLLSVDIQTGLVPGPEFERIETTLYRTAGGRFDPNEVDRIITQDVQFPDRFERGRRVAEFGDLTPGVRSVRVRLFRPAATGGALLVERWVRVRFTGSYALLVRLDRDCVVATCPSPGGSPAFTECLAGRCVDPECDLSDPSTYADHCCDPAAPASDCPNILYCNDVSECAAVGACAEAQCIAGACVESPIADACAPVEWCDPSPVGGGCRPLMSFGDAGIRDAGTDADLDAGDSDAGFDGGESDAGDSDSGVDGGEVDMGMMSMDPDLGFDAGFDAGEPDLGFDAGFDAGDPDLGFDAGEPDLGFDAGFDAGEPDLGFDAGFDAGEPDLGFDAGEPDLGFDAGPEDMGADAGRDPGLDPSGRRILWVTNTDASGPGSLSAALTKVNDECASGPYAVHFDIPMEDPGFVMGLTGYAWWRISATTVGAVLCPGTLVDGTTQTLRRGDTNPFVITGVRVGESDTPLPDLHGPEIELRGIRFGVRGDDVIVRGLALKSLEGGGARFSFEQNFLATEPDSLVSIPAAERAGFAGFYTIDCPDCVIRESVFMVDDAADGTRSLVQVRDRSPRMTIRDNYFGGQVRAAGSADLLYLVPADDPRVLHNYLGARGYEFYVEWVPGYGGEISENTFEGVMSEPLAISRGGAARMVANVYRTLLMPL
jgi:hypothetical protein